MGRKGEENTERLISGLPLCQFVKFCFRMLAIHLLICGGDFGNGIKRLPFIPFEVWNSVDENKPNYLKYCDLARLKVESFIKLYECYYLGLETLI